MRHRQVITAYPALADDARSLDGLKGIAARDPKAAVREAAKQFESLFMPVSYTHLTLPTSDLV